MSDLFEDALSNTIATECIKKVVGLFLKAVPEKEAQSGTQEQVVCQVIDGFAECQKRFEDRHGQMKVLGRAKPISLESVYIAAKCSELEQIHAFKPLEDQEKVFRLRGHRQILNNAEKKTQDVLALANQEKYLMLFGSPGAGKSTLLKKIGLEALKGKGSEDERSCFPVLLNLREVVAGQQEIAQEIADEFKHCGIPYAEEGTAELLRAGQLLILFDGLDEVSEQGLDTIVETIGDFVDRYDQNRFVITCRTVAYKKYFSKFTHAVIADFDDSQIQQFIQLWFEGNPQLANELWKLLKNSEQEGTCELCTNPLLLTMVCLEYRRSLQLPNNRAVLFEKALRIYLEEWDASKLIRHAEVYKGLDTRAKEILLSEIALNSLEADRPFLPCSDLAKQISDLIKDLRPDEKNVDSNAIIQAIAKQHGLLVERASGVYSFAQLALQEYLAAKAVVDKRSFPDLIKKHLTNLRWREVFLLSAGLLNPVDQLLLSIEQEAQKLLQTPAIQDLLLWCERIPSGSSGRFTTAYGRASALAIALDLNRTPALERPRTLALALSRALSMDLALDRALALDLTLALDLEHTRAKAVDRVRTRALSSDRALTLDLSRTLARVRTYAFSQFFSEEICASLMKLTQLPKENSIDRFEEMHTAILAILDIPLKALTPKDIEALADFLAAQQLLVDCRKTAVRITHQVWESILERMLVINP
jgi:energy-coupling factor transporter ATP-binding protein EcfA2